MGFPRQEYWRGLPFPSPGDLPNPGMEPGFPALQADTLPSGPPGKAVLRASYGLMFVSSQIQMLKSQLPNMTVIVCEALGGAFSHGVKASWKELVSYKRGFRASTSLILPVWTPKRCQLWTSKMALIQACWHPDPGLPILWICENSNPVVYKLPSLQYFVIAAHIDWDIF